MRYVSTRGAWRNAPKPFLSILLEGLAPDGGLALPVAYPRLGAGELARWRGLDYRALAFEILSRYIDDIPVAELRAIVERTYRAEVFGSDDITPLSTLEPGLHLLHLSNGPTLAFKDIALQLLGGLFEYALEREGRVINIVGATSGDTGSAAEVALEGKARAAVFMLSPAGRMSPFQTAQMFSLHSPNIHNLAIEGTFDDCQDLVKAINADAAFKSAHAIGAVNSINWARVVAQAVYYFKGYFAATAAHVIPAKAGTHHQGTVIPAKAGTEIDYVVPSGNFGNVFAGHVAREMGLPIRRLVVATNENDVLDEFFRTGVYRPRAAVETHATSSPSMDIAKASNFERYIADMTGRDDAEVRALWEALAREGRFDFRQGAHGGHWDAVLRSGFVSGTSSHAARVATIREVKRRYGVVVDPHTADGLGVALAMRDPAVPTIALETALPAKFAATIREALGSEAPRPAAYEGLEARPQRFTRMPVDLARLRDYIGAHAIAP